MVCGFFHSVFHLDCIFHGPNLSKYPKALEMIRLSVRADGLTFFFSKNKKPYGVWIGPSERREHL